MTRQPYEATDPSELIVRDHLAISRTALANERTFLAYVRTSLAFLITGGSLIEIVEGRVATIGGWAFIVVGVVTAIIGSWRAYTVGRTLRRMRRE